MAGASGTYLSGSDSQILHYPVDMGRQSSGTSPTGCSESMASRPRCGGSEKKFQTGLPAGNPDKQLLLPAIQRQQEAGDVGLEVGAAVPEDDEGDEAVVAGRRLARGYVVEAARWAPQLKTQCPGIKV